MRREAGRGGAAGEQQGSRAADGTEPQLPATASHPLPSAGPGPGRGAAAATGVHPPRGSKPASLRSPLHSEHRGGGDSRGCWGENEAPGRRGNWPCSSTAHSSGPGSCVVACRLQQRLVPRPGPCPLPLCSYPKPHLATCPARHPVADGAGGPVGGHHEAAREEPGRPAVCLLPAATRPRPRWALRPAHAQSSPGTGLGGSQRPALAARCPSAAVRAGGLRSSEQPALMETYCVPRERGQPQLPSCKVGAPPPTGRGHPHPWSPASRVNPKLLPWPEQHWQRTRLPSYQVTAPSPWPC